MRVKVTPLHYKGRNLKRVEINQAVAHEGDLDINERRDHERSRTVATARLTDICSGVASDLLPELVDVRLHWAKNKQMRLSGIEDIDGVCFAQTWHVEVL